MADRAKRTGARVVFECPGCKSSHGVNVIAPAGGRKEPVWTWCGSLAYPTITPSILVTWTTGEGMQRYKHVCHSFVRGGRIQFLNDCTHALAGKTVDLPDVES